MIVDNLQKLKLRLNENFIKLFRIFASQRPVPRHKKLKSFASKFSLTERDFKKQLPRQIKMVKKAQRQLPQHFKN